MNFGNHSGQKTSTRRHVCRGPGAACPARHKGGLRDAAQIEKERKKGEVTPARPGLPQGSAKAVVDIFQDLAARTEVGGVEIAERGLHGAQGPV